jgi:hypothetical protein
MNKVTIGELISYFDEQVPNEHTQEAKIRWLNEIETQIYRDIILTHEGADDYSFDGYDNSTDPETQLIVDAEYSEMYRYWLEKSVHYADREIEAYNNALAMYQAYYDSFLAAYNRRHRSNKTGTFHF